MAEWEAYIDYRANGQRNAMTPFMLYFGVILSNEAMSIKINVQQKGTLELDKSDYTK